jgi:hypothetical protein
MQKTWCSKRRMKTWAKNSKKWDNQKPKNKLNSSMENYMTARKQLMGL